MTRARALSERGGGAPVRLMSLFGAQPMRLPSITTSRKPFVSCLNRESRAQREGKDKPGGLGRKRAEHGKGSLDHAVALARSFGFCDVLFSHPSGIALPSDGPRLLLLQRLDLEPIGPFLPHEENLVKEDLALLQLVMDVERTRLYRLSSQVGDGDRYPDVVSHGFKPFSCQVFVDGRNGAVESACEGPAPLSASGRLFLLIPFLQRCCGAGGEH